jgi:ribonuclease BN (tRNA processing enzyme)
MQKVKIVFLGTNGWYDTETGNTICTLIVAPKLNIILDAGIGIHKADKYINPKNPVYLFISHFHLDHIMGLHILMKFRFKSLKIYGQPDTKKILTHFLSKKFSAPFSMLPYKTELIDIAQGWHDHPIRFQCLKLKHPSPCIGYRFEIDKKVVSYCIDTGYCKNAVELAKNADLLISECSFLSGQVNPAWPHLNPELAAKLAVESKAKRLALTHYDAAVYTQLKQRRAAERKARRIFHNSFAAMDSMQTTL